MALGRPTGRSFQKALSLLLTALALVLPAGAAERQETASTDDLRFLLGEWDVSRIYQPGTENERSLAGSLVCENALSDQFIECAFRFERAERPPIHDNVFFNFNPIYGVYESVWVSATWPIKVLMSAEPSAPSQNLIWTTDFLIEDGVREWVRSEWFRCADGGFLRRTQIRTSRDPDGQWLHWMDERSVRPAVAATRNSPAECS